MVSEINIPLSVSGINRIARQMKRLSKQMNVKGQDSIPAEITEKVALDTADKVRANIESIPDLDGNILGASGEAVSVRFMGATDLRVTWVGKQIAFLEFGTGAAGSGKYPNQASMHKFNYSPDPTKESWNYLSSVSGQVETSYGIAPQAPLYRAAQDAKSSNVARQVLAERLERVFSSR